MERIGLSFSLICWAVFYVYWLASAFATKRTAARESVIEALAYRIPTAAGVFMLVLAPRMPKPLSLLAIRSSAGVCIGVMTLSLAGLCICLWARMVLGRNWSSTVVIKVGHELVQRGPYRYVRHPIYTGMILMFAANVILAGRVGGILGLFLFAFGFVVKLLREERLMMQQFPSAYPQYVKRTKRLVPFVI
jgi:protein-S-isoprenylcysteine O-methyltransferase Ste14